MTSQAKDIRLIIDERREDIIRWHKENAPAAQIIERLGLNVTPSYLLNRLRERNLTRRALGLNHLPPRDFSPSALDIHALPRPSPMQVGEPYLDYIARHRDLIIECHQLNLTLLEFETLLKLRPHHIQRAFTHHGLTRQALGLGANPRCGVGNLMTLDMAFSAEDDWHIRRGHYCGIAPRVIGAICRRRANDVTARAQSLGLRHWVVIDCPRRRQELSREFDAQNSPPVTPDNRPISLGYDAK